MAVTVCQGGADAQNATYGEGSDAPFLFGRVEHVSYESSDVRVGASPEQSATAGVAEAPVVGASGGALVINATFDSSITNDPQSAAIQAMINKAVSIFQSLLNDPITVSILFRYATTKPDGTPLASGALATSTFAVYLVPWNTYTNALTADATTANDLTANGSLPASALSTNIKPSSADGRAVSLNTPPVMFADGSVGVGGPYDGIVTLNSGQPFAFTRPPSTGIYDALRSTEHEMDEVLGFGSYLNTSGSDLRPQDLFSWSAAGARNLTSSGSRFFSINGGATNIVGFNQNPAGDFGDWLSGSCPQANPYVQNAFSCQDQASDVTPSSPEGINLDVIGYDLIAATSTTTTSTTTTTNTTAPPTTTTFSTTTTISSTTTTTSSTATTTSSTAPTTTTTSEPTTTTTLAAGDCSTVPEGPTFGSIICRLEALLTLVEAEPGLGVFQAKLAATLTTAHDRAVGARDFCGSTDPKHAKQRIKQVARQVIQYAHRLSGLPARKRLDRTLRAELLAPAAPLKEDLRSLRDALRCPVDASGS